MKYVLVIPDGVADEGQPSLNGLTPLQAANVPNMDAVATAGIIGRTDNVPASMPSGSDVGTMTLFGYDTLKYHTGRAPIEAAAQGIELNPGDWAVRCNLVTVQDEKMVSFTSGQYPTEAGHALIKLLQQDQCGDSHWKYVAGVSYRNLLLYRAAGGTAPLSKTTTSTPPHDITDQDITAHLPAGPGADELKQLMLRSRELFADADVNLARAAQAEHQATQTWLWGMGERPNLPLFKDKFGVNGAVITAVDLLRGMGRLIGWDVVEVEGATGYLDTDYAAKGQAAIETLKRDDIDFVVVHVEATDEASHEGDVKEKLKAVENIDRHIVKPVHDWLKSQGDYRLLISPDHPTYLRTKTHSHGDCPFAMCGTGLSANSGITYDEVAAAASDVGLPEGHLLMDLFLKS
ncbi:MAG: cofactor-independent phosphoglycerate mutase [Fuerstiella sp.]